MFVLQPQVKTKSHLLVMNAAFFVDSGVPTTRIHLNYKMG